MAAESSSWLDQIWLPNGQGKIRRPPSGFATAQPVLFLLLMQAAGGMAAASLDPIPYLSRRRRLLDWIMQQGGAYKFVCPILQIVRGSLQVIRQLTVTRDVRRLGRGPF
jgi:hypothetical protein